MVQNLNICPAGYLGSYHLECHLEKENIYIKTSILVNDGEAQPSYIVP